MTTSKPNPILELLQQVITTDPHQSICSQVWSLTYRQPTLEDEFDQFMLNTSKKWEHFSGNENYPVPESKFNKTYGSAHQHYTVAMVSDTLWSNTYGELRKDLLKFLIQEATQNGIT